MAMKQKKSHQHHDIDDDADADDTLRNSAKFIYGDINTVASSICTSTGSYDTTEDLTDTDTSSQKKSESSLRKISSGDNRKNVSKKSFTESSDNDVNVDGRIRFSMKANKMHEVESHENFTSKERTNYWWSDREKDRMMAKHERLVAKYEQQRTATKPGTSKKSPVDKAGSYRGLESWTAAGSLKLDYTIEQCISAVMDEQDRQWNENDDDYEGIAKKSMAVTEDSARRARLNGLQDAQETLRVRGESWSNKSGGDDMSVGSAYSTGTLAIAKKKKRSKLLARLDDSHNLPKSFDDSDKEDVLASLKKHSSKNIKKDKKKKKKTSKKSHKNEMGEEIIVSALGKTKKKKKSKDKITGMNKKLSSSPPRADRVDITDQDQAHSRTTNTTQPTTIASRIYEQKKSLLDAPDVVGDVAYSTTTTDPKIASSFLAGPTMPISPLTHFTTNSAGTDECPLLTTLRRQQEQLRQNSSGHHNDIKASIYHHRQETLIEDEDDFTEDSSPLLQTLRRQQKKQALTWQNHQQDDPSDSGNGGAPSYSGGSVNKATSFRGDNSRAGDSVSADSSDPPGRRPRRLASRHVGVNRAGANLAIPENFIHEQIEKNSLSKSKGGRSRSRSYEKKKRTGRSGLSSYTPPPPIPLPSAPYSSAANEKRTQGSFLNSPSATGKKSIKSLRYGAKILFKKNSRK